MAQYWFLVGVCSGTVLGVSGAGGAMVSVPLFVWIFNYSVKDVMTCSLLCAVLGATINWVAQRRNTNFKAVLSVVSTSWIGSRIGVQLKASIPEWALVLVFLAVCTLMMRSLWGKKKEIKPLLNLNGVKGWSLCLSSGVGIGALTALTGLGGGVVLVPLFFGLLGLEFSQAVSSSLLSTVFFASSSFLFQWKNAMTLLDRWDFLSLLGGTFIAAASVKVGISKVKKHHFDQLRRWTLSAVICVALFSLTMRTFFPKS